jgi:TolB-like protein
MEERIGFGGYQFGVKTWRLWSAAREVRLTPKASAVLAMLVAHAGALVTKDELFTAVWSDAAVSDDALTSCIQELRRALEDDARRPRFIETRHRRGFRFIADVTAASVDDAEDSGDGCAIAVLPFDDMSPRRDQAYLCDSLAEEVINVLTRIKRLRVVSRTASFQFRGSAVDVRAIGRHLAAEAVVEGSVRTANGRIRVTAQIIETATGFQRWSCRFDRTDDDIFAIQDEIASRIAAAVRCGRRARHGASAEFAHDPAELPASAPDVAPQHAFRS